MLNWIADQITFLDMHVATPSLGFFIILPNAIARQKRATSQLFNSIRPMRVPIQIWQLPIHPPTNTKELKSIKYNPFNATSLEAQ